MELRIHTTFPAERKEIDKMRSQPRNFEVRAFINLIEMYGVNPIFQMYLAASKCSRNANYPLPSPSVKSDPRME